MSIFLFTQDYKADFNLLRIPAALVLIFLLSGIPDRAAWAETPTPAASTNNKSAPQTISQQVGAIPQTAVVSKLALATSQIGALRCVERADQIAKFLGSGTDDLLILDHVAGVPTTDLVTATLLVPLGSGDYSTVEIALASTANGCTAHYSASIHAPVNCAQAEKKFYGNLTFKSLGSVPYRLAFISANARVVSRELPSGCLMTKHEVIR